MKATKQQKEDMKEYYLKNKKKILQKRRDYYKTHKSERKQYRELNKEQIKNQAKKYHARLEIKERTNQYNKYKRNIDINFKLSSYLKTRIWWALKRNIKSEHTLELLGCNVKQLKKYLEKQFIRGMSWSNYGKWHIDHIKPCASFDLSKKSEQRKCFNYKNLRPLWAVDNLERPKGGIND